MMDFVHSLLGQISITSNTKNRMKENKIELMKDLTKWKEQLYIYNFYKLKQQSISNLGNHIKLHLPTK